MKKTVLDILGLVMRVAIVVAVGNRLKASAWVIWGLPIVICGGATIR